MLKCEGGCQQLVGEYYRMPDGKIFCEKCWRYGRDIAEKKCTQVENEIRTFEQKRKSDTFRLKQLDYAIELEKSKFKSQWSAYEDEGTIFNKPSNFENVELLKRQRRDLQMEINCPLYTSHKISLENSKSYYANSKFISSSESYYFENVIIPLEKEAERKKLEEERQKEEKRRLAEIEQEQKKQEEKRKNKADLKSLEDAILNNIRLPLKDRMKVAKETYIEEVMLRCLKDRAMSVQEAVKQNSNKTKKVISQINKIEKIAEDSKPASVHNFKEVIWKEQEDKGSFLSAIFNWLSFIAVLALVVFLISNASSIF